jgi:hypothetical protein
MSDVNKSISISYRADVQNLVNGLKKVGNLSEKESKRLVKDLDKAYTKASKASEKSARKQERALKKVGKTAKGVGKGIQSSFTNVSLAVAGAGVAVLAFGQHIANMSNQLVDASTKTGVSVDTLNGLRLASQGAGVSFEELEVGLVKLPQLMQKASDGSKTAQKAFESLGVQTTKTVDGFQQLRSADEVLKDVFNSLQAIESAEEKVARASEIFGRTAGPKFIQSGAIDNLQAFVDLANEFGVASGPRMQKEMAQFQRNASTAMMVFQGEILRTFDVLMGGEGGAGGGLNKAMDLLVESFVVLGSVAQNVLAGLNLHFQKLGFKILPVVKILMGDVGEGVVLMEAFKQPISEIEQLLQGEIGQRFSFPIEHAMVRLEEFRTLVESTSPSPTRGGGGARRTGGGAGATQQTTKAVDELAESTKLLEKIDKEILDTMTKIRDERVSELTGEEKIIALRDIALNKVHEEKMALDLSIQSQIEKLKLLKQTQKVQDQIADLEIVQADRMEQLDKERRDIIQEAFDAQKNNILEEGELKIQVAGEVTEAQLENDDKLKKSARQVFDEYTQGFGMVAQGFGIAGDLIEQNSIKNKKNAELVFNLRKASAISEIAIATATNLVDVFPSPFLMAGAIGLGIAQTALVASEQPKFHMGGMIGDSSPLAPDETMVRAKSGEAILSTSAVNRIGEEGVRALENGSGITPQIIVMNPFKHYDRFIRGRDALGMSGTIGTGRRGY